MQLGPKYKALVALALIAAMVLLMALHDVDTAAGMSPITLIVGYIIGNGVSAATGNVSQPMVQPTPEKVASTTAEG